MYRMCHIVDIGSTRLRIIDSIDIKRSVDTLSDTAVINLPGTYLNTDIDIESKIHRGEKVSIQLGYDGTMYEEFKGYVRRIRRKEGGVEIECEDDMYLFRKGVRNRQYAQVSVNTILKDVCSQVGMKVVCSYSFSYDKFVIKDAQAIEVLQKIQSECGCMFSIFNGVLRVEPKYAKTYGEAVYDFAKNIEKSSDSLEWMNEEDKQVYVKVTGTNEKGHKIQAEKGMESGATEKVTINLPGVSTVASLQNRANETYKERCWTGYSGKFSGWLLPYCDKGYKIKLKDASKEYRDGTYYVKGVEVSYSQSGGVRTVEIGMKL